jgi:hypothetical protein
MAFSAVRARKGAIDRGNGMALYDRHGHFTRSVVRPAPQR